MPASFDLTSDSEDLWTPIAFTPPQRVLHDEHHLQVYGRLRPGSFSASSCGDELETVAAAHPSRFPEGLHER